MEISEATSQNFDSIGSTVENIKVFKNYLDKDECAKIVELIKSTETSNNRLLQDDPSGTPPLSLIYYDSISLPDKYVPQVHKLLEEEYKLNVKPRHARFAEWRHNNSQSISIDDMGSKDSNHMAGWVYLNEDYDGGELHFISQRLSFKPEAGDLIMFPGNKHYWYNVAPANGSRYIMPIWFDFKA